MCVNHSMNDATVLCLRVVENYPQDYLAIRFGIVLCLMTGTKPIMLEFVNNAKTNISYLQSAECCSFISFAYVENNDLDSADFYALRALEINPHNSWAQHNLAHVCAGKNQFEQGKMILKNKSED